MYLVKKQHPEQSIGRIREDTRQLLIRSQSQPLNAMEEQRLVRLLNDWRERGYWIACDCKRSEPPLMTVTRRDNGTLYITRINARGDHADHCPMKGLSYKRSTNRSVSVTQACDMDAVLNLHRDAKSVATQKDNTEETDNSRQAGGYTPRLARVLYTLLTKAKLNLIDINALSVVDQYQQLNQAAKQLKVSQQLPLSEVLYTHPKGVRIAFKTLNDQKKAGLWEDKPYAVAVLVVDEIEDHDLICQLKDETLKLHVEGQLKFVSGRLGEQSGPYLVIFTITDTAEKPGFYAPYNAYAMPVVSKGLLVPVDSRYERMVIQALRKWLPWWQKKGLNVTIEKPLFDEEVMVDGESDVVRPDIILRTANKSCTLEVGGSLDKSYLERKARMHELMSQHRRVFNFDAISAEKAQRFDESLTALIKQISAYFFEA